MISVVVPTYGRPQALAACLSALADSRIAPGEFEVIVVDDGSPEPLDAVVEAHRGRLQVALHRQSNRGPAAARNAGAARARGSVIAFTDDDCLPDPAWLRHLSARAEAHEGALIGGRTENVLTSNPFASASQHLVSYLYEYGRTEVGGPRWSGFFTSNNLAVPTAAFRDLGGFDEGFPLAAGEDRDFCARWVEEGRPCLYAPEALVRHAHPLSGRGFLRQHWNYGRGAFHFHEARRRRGLGGMHPEPPAFYAGMVRYPLRAEGPIRGAFQAALIAVAQGVNALGFFVERRRRRNV